jgi:DNA mismatch endonuclease (patch repair protein)
MIIIARKAVSTNVMDIFPPEKRREIMSKIRHKNSQAELTVFAYLRQNKIYFQKHYKKAPGNPDISLPRKKKAVFIDGDYWHGRYLNKVTHDKFWIDKITGNKLRDEKVNKELREHGWNILRIWETDINRKRTREEALAKIKNFLLS